MLEISVRTQHEKLMSHTKLSKQRIDRSDLQALAPATVAKVCRGDVIFALWNDQRQGSESIEDLLSRFRSVESLQNLLKDQAGGEDRFLVLKSFFQEPDAGVALALIATQSE